jgi:hypothetical protein
MKALAALPPGVDETLGLVERFDDCLLHGFARLGDVHRSSLRALVDVLGGSPLGPAVLEAVDAVGRSEFVTRTFLALASARVALLGAVHDALLAQARAALDRPWQSIEERPLLSPGGLATALSSTQQWLTDVAISGFRQLEESGVAPFAATLHNLQDEPNLTGLSALLTGFFGELLRSVPVARQPVLPAFRWADLWSAAFIRTQQLPAPPGFREAKGTLTPLGLDVQSHENFVCALLYGLLDDGKVRTVRVPFNGYKVAVIDGPEIWDLFGAFARPILEALEEHRVLRVANAELREDGDLIFRSPPRVDGAGDPLALAGRLTSLPPPPALARHPVHIAEVVHLQNGHDLPLAVERIPPWSELNADTAVDAPELIGLLRFDRGGWRVQPLCIRHQKRGLVQTGQELAGARKKLKHQSLEVLQERASRLLRRS